MRLRHYSANVVTKVQRIQPRVMGITMKPEGLWVSDDDCEHNWKTWCEDEKFQLDQLKHCHAVELNGDPNICYLRNASDIDAFTRVFVMKDHAFGRLGWIDWEPVYSKFQGIIITPYIWERRIWLGSFWYYTWDCASGCIWDPEAISSIVLT